MVQQGSETHPSQAQLADHYEMLPMKMKGIGVL